MTLESQRCCSPKYPWSASLQRAAAQQKIAVLQLCGSISECLHRAQRLPIPAALLFFINFLLYDDFDFRQHFISFQHMDKLK
jgi:hypothetical protein